MTSKNQNILPPRHFAKRVVNYTLASTAIIVVSLMIGILGYHYFGEIGCLDSLYNPSMILTGMGPVNVMEGDAAKWFGSFYALFSGVIFLSTVAIFFAPFAHHLRHLLHVDLEGDQSDI
ncbi:MAG: hypothetical protein O2867_09095 [Bacteroidetes bacterium]|nr:hypothetical protein [Bacteroidota bacterium]